MFISVLIFVANLIFAANQVFNSDPSIVSSVGLVEQQEVGSALASPGSLVICGGGRLSGEIVDQFIALAGAPDGHLVVIPTAGSGDGPDFSDSVTRWEQRGFNQVSILHTRDPEQANDPEFISPLLTATAVWISGGQQSRLATSYAGTRVEIELVKLLERGGVIGGTSAGAAIMSPVMIASGRDEPRIIKGLSLFTGTIVDQHFLKRSRMNRLIQAVSAHPDLIGVGIDEGTALVVQGQSCQVLGDSYVVLVEVNDEGSPRMRVLSDGDQVELDLGMDQHQ